jgi:glycosyltransferase involved in cell wall biosynthesis
MNPELGPEGGGWMKLWVDVEDLFDYALHVKRPSGIQRLAFELQRALVEISPDSVHFIRHGKQAGSFISVPFTDIEALFTDLSAELAPRLEGQPRDQEILDMQPRSLYRRVRRRASAALPKPLRAPSIRLWAKSAETSVAVVDLLKVVFSRETWRTPKPVLPSVVEQKPALPSVVEQTPVASGDWFVVLGSPWSCPGYAPRVANYCERHGLRFALLMYDIIPIRRPEWVDISLRHAFHEWFHAVVPLADAVFAISRTTAADIERYEKETSFGLLGRVQTIPLGTGLGRPPVPMRTRRLPPRRSFALIVSTIEARKNHLLLFRIWRELAEAMPQEKIPTLVFAGRVGWLVQDLMQQLKNTEYLNGKIVLIDSPSDGELAALYEDCMFTLYPSFYEGWGLPVTESLVYGAPCLSSNRTSLPEAGGDLAAYFDPDNLAEAVRAVRQVIEDPEALQAWRERVARDFKPVPWTDSARAVINHLQQVGSVEVSPRLSAAVAAAD